MGRENASAGCLFCRIAAGTVPAERSVQTNTLTAFLDIQPIRPGHTQIVPKAHYDTFELLPPDLASEILFLGQRLARAMKRLYGVPRVGFAFTGSDIAHVHAHLVPLHSAMDITSRAYIAEQRVTFRAPPRPSDAELAETAGSLRREIGRDTQDPATGP